MLSFSADWGWRPSAMAKKCYEIWVLELLNDSELVFKTVHPRTSIYPLGLSCLGQCYEVRYLTMTFRLKLTCSWDLWT